jgi:hypothetical protein
VLGDRRLRFPRECTTFAGEVLKTTGAFTSAGPPGDLDPASRVVLLRRLAVEGVLARA